MSAIRFARRWARTMSCYSCSIGMLPFGSRVSSALALLLIAALFWKGSSKWGALAATVWTAFAVIAVAVFQASIPAPAPGPPVVAWSLGGIDILSRTPGGTAVLGFMPVAPMTLVSTALIVLVSLLTRKPAPQTIARYFPK